MPLTLATGADLTASAQFQGRVAMAFYFVARQVIGEDVSTPGHEVRVNFARSIVLQDYTKFMQYAAMVATDPQIVAAGPYATANILTAPTDDRIIGAVAAMWNGLAGVR